MLLHNWGQSTMATLGLCLCHAPVANPRSKLRVAAAWLYAWTSLIGSGTRASGVNSWPLMMSPLLHAQQPWHQQPLYASQFRVQWSVSAHAATQEPHARYNIWNE